MRVIRSKRGKQVILLNPAEKGSKYAYELKTRQRVTNAGEFKGPRGLTKEQAAFRAGYLTSRRDSAKAYKASLKSRKKIK